MNHRASGNQTGRSSRSSQSGESSDLEDMKALAAATARPTSAVPAQVRGPELSGMVGRRDSVVGARIDDRAPLSAGLSWLWVAAGCAAVLAPGLAGVLVLSRASASEPDAVVVVRPVPAAVAEVDPAPGLEIEPLAHLPAMIPDAPVARPAPRAPSPRYFRHRSGEARRAAAAAAALGNTADGSRAAAGAPGATGATGTGPAAAPSSAPAPAAAAPPANAAPAEVAADDSDKADKTQETEKPKKVVEAAADEPSNGPPLTVKQLRSALTRLQPRVYQCHQRFQVDGVADVKVAVNPSGTVESASLAGEFEGTPTGDCIVRLVSAASFPSFDGSESIHVSHSFSLE